MSQERRVCLYSGHVQGVGFRYTTQHIARDFAVTGFVRNLPDGRVELLAEGDRDELDRFFAAVKLRMGEFIRDAKCSTQPHTAEFASFSIRH